MADFLEKQLVPIIACRCPITLCRKLHAPTIASDTDHALYQEAGYCPEFNTVVGYYERVVDQYRSVFTAAPEPTVGGRGGGPRTNRRPAIACEIAKAGCRGDGARACILQACKVCCSKTGVRCTTHDAPRRPAAPPRVRQHGLLNLHLSVRDLKQSRVAAVVLPADVFHLALLEREQFTALAFDELDAASLQYYDYAEYNWRALTHETAVTLAPTTRTLLLRADSRLKRFPPLFVCDFVDGYDRFCSYIGPDTEQAVAFKKALPDYRYNADEFQAALDLWGSTPHDTQIVFKDAGRTDAGLWAELVKDAERRRRVAAIRQRRSTTKPAVKPEVIEIYDD